jgi:hypothetical protein
MQAPKPLILRCSRVSASLEGRTTSPQRLASVRASRLAFGSHLSMRSVVVRLEG